MDHEVDDPTLVQGTQVLSSHPKELFIVGQELSGHTKEQGRKARQHQSNGRDGQKEAAIPKKTRLTFFRT